ncbi:alpha/beta family hydrolase [Alishewanella tabrizica]|nr:alpha/beta family hydrolase [Alishewanella tabrizica]
MKAQLLLMHGAGASTQSPFMQQLTLALTEHNIQVSLFDFAYMQQREISGSKRPAPKAALLVPELSSVLSTLPGDLPLFIGGKSMGGRIASLWAALEPDIQMQSARRVQGVFAYGYPFHPPKKTQWRIAHFSNLSMPLCIIQGERDPFGHRLEVEAHLWPKVTLQWLTTADHDFKPLQRSGVNQAQLIAQAALITSESIDAIISKT